MGRRNALMKRLLVVVFALTCGSLLAVSETGDSPLWSGVDLQYVPVQYKTYDWGSGATTSQTGSGGRLAVEWIPFDLYGKLGVGGGLGVNVIKNADFGGTRATLTAVPIEASVGYRLDFFHNQILVPYGKLSLAHTLTFQRGIDVPGYRGFWSLDKILGVGLNLNLFDQKTARNWDRRSGVNATYLVVEYVKSDALGSSTVNLNYSNFRFGLRFEI